MGIARSKYYEWPSARTTAENAPMSVITGPKVSPSLKDAG